MFGVTGESAHSFHDVRDHAGRGLAVCGLDHRFEPVFVEGIEAMQQAIVDAAQPGDVVITMGAGSIGQVAGRLAPQEGAE